MTRYISLVAMVYILVTSVTLTAAQQMSMRHFSRDEGLVQNDVTRIYQSQQGYLWVATYAGLSRFDGKRFETFNEATSGLGGTAVKAITEDAQGQLWVGYAGGIARLEGKRFVNFTPQDGLLGHDVVDIWPAPKAGLWIVTEKGVSYFNNGNFATYPLRGIDPSRYSHITGTPTGVLLVAFQEGVYEWQAERQAFVVSSVVTFPVQALHYHAQDGFIYLIDDTTLYRYKNGTVTPVATSPLSSTPLIGFAFGRQQTLWIYSDEEIWQWHAQSSTVYTNVLLQESSISHVLEDREGNLWVGNWGRLSMLVNRKIRHYTTGLQGNIVTDIHEDSAHHLWIAGNKGIVKLSPQGTPVATIAARYVNALIQQQDTLLAATYYDGLRNYDLQGEFLRQLGNKPFNTIMLDTAGTYWLGGYHGLYSMTKDHLALELDTASPLLKSNTIWALLEDRHGRIWAGTENGLVRKDTDNTWKSFDTTHGLPHQAVWSLVEHPTWGVIVGTDKGAARWTGEHFEAVPWDTPLIEFMAVDPQGRLWVGTDNGIYRVNQHQHIDLFLDKARGLSNNASYVNSVLVTDTAIYAGTYKGLVRIDLDIEHDSKATPLLDVYQLDINGKANPIAVVAQSLPYSNKNLTFRFNGIYMYLPESITYRYYLEGFDQAWHEATTINQAVYTNLPPGDYTLHVQALAEGKKASPVQEIPFRLLPPFWQTWWAYSLYLLLGVATVWGTTRIQVQRVRHKAELQLQEKQRQLQEKQRFLDASERFVPGEFLAYLHRESIVEVELGDCIEQTMSVLFSDIRSFTTLSEHMQPEESLERCTHYIDVGWDEAWTGVTHLDTK